MQTEQVLKRGTEASPSAPRRVLFVCTGNVCRSPMAAARLNDMSRPREICSANGEVQTQARYVASSAGVCAMDGDRITPAAEQALREQGVVPRPDNDYPAHRARMVSEEMLREADEVVGMTASHTMELMMRFPELAPKMRLLPIDIPDPFGGSIEVYRACLTRLRYALEKLYFSGDRS